MERACHVSLQVPGLVVNSRNHAVAAEPFGLPEPFSWAVLVVTAVAGEVVTAGLSNVVNDTGAPYDVPSEFGAIAQT